MRVKWSSAARRDVRHFVEYIGARRPDAARRIVGELRRVVEIVRQQPEMGVLMEELVEEGKYRRVVVEGYWVIYLRADDCVFVVRVWDGRRDPGSLTLK